MNDIPITVGIGVFVHGGAGYVYENLNTAFGIRDELSALFGVVKLTSRFISSLAGTHLLPAEDDEIQRIAASLNDNVKRLAAAHCTGEPAFAILQKALGDRFPCAGVARCCP